MSRALGIAVALLAGALVLPRAASAFSCRRTDPSACPSPGATCFTDCTESDLRAVLETLNGCGARDVTVQLGPDAATTCASAPIVLRMDATAPATAPGSCGDDHANRYNALCLAGTGIVVDGRGAILRYAGDQICASCDGECTLCPGGSCAHRQPALFVVRGSGNTIRNLDMRFFPEGIHLRAGDGHAVEQVTSRFVCEEALTVDEGGGHRVSGGTFVGNTEASGGPGTCYRRIQRSTCASDAECPGGARCYCGDLGLLGACAVPPPPPLWPAATPGQCFASARCGLDKALQVNAGQATIAGNRIDGFSQPVSVLAGTHLIEGNVSCGDREQRNVCQAYGVRGGAVTFRGNRIDHCKFGIRLDGAAQVDAVGNVITNGWVSAFQMKGQGDARLRAEGNMLRNNGHSTESDCQRGSLVVTGNTLARVDFGGGDGTGAAVLAGPPSAGGNVSCQAGTGAPHVWNGAPCDCGAACVDAGASLGLGGAFVPALILPPDAGANVVDDPPVETRVSAASIYDACDAIVVEECECPPGGCVPPSQAALRVSRVVVRPERGTILVRGSLSGRPAGDLVVEMPGLLANPVTWAAGECVTATGGSVTCSTSNGTTRARFTPRGGFRLVIAAPTLVPRAATDVTVVLAHDGTRRTGSLPASDCRTRNGGLRCRAR